jgi:phosphatidylglycerophosphatase A
MSIQDLSAELVATWFGCGKSPVAPGTVGSIGAVPLHLLLSALGPVPYWTTTIGLTLLGVWAAQRVAEKTGDKDPQSVVIDEVAGTLIAMGLVRRRSFATRLAALLLFRAFDIVKPSIINRSQELEPAGVGVMADDVLAGLAAGVMARWL